MPFITVFTATYNRGYVLHSAYNSLKKQTSKNFEWLIVDDGSTDNTEDLVKSWQREDNGFPIKYIKADHRGLPNALNTGVHNATTEWFCKLDSDDYFKENTIELCIEWLNEISNNEKIAGIGFARCYPNGKFMRDLNPSVDLETGYIDATNIERKKYQLDMDMCEVMRTSLYKKYPFKCYENETFAPEQISYNEMALDGYKIRWRAEKLYICDYLPDGLTKNDLIVKKNPIGYAMMHNQNALINAGIKNKFLSCTQMISLLFYAKKLNYLKYANMKLLTALAFPFGIVLGVRRKKQFAKL